MIKIEWIDKPETGPSIYLCKDTLKRLNINWGKVVFHFGAFKKEVTVYQNEELSPETIGISRTIFEGKTVPDTLTYDIRVEERDIYIGPVVAFVMAYRKKNLTAEVLERFKVYAKAYQHVNGLIYLCADDGINPEKQTVEGYYYDPTKSVEEEQWRAGTFFYPDAVYRRTSMRNTNYHSIIENIGDKIFNGHFFNKWDLWEWLSPDSFLKDYLPHTEKLKSSTDLINMLDRYPSVYLKPSSSQKNMGLWKVEREEGRYCFKDSKDSSIVLEKESLENFIRKLIKDKEYLIQQTIQIKRHNDRLFDFRVIMQKDKSLEWNCTGIIARFGARNGIITTNFNKGYGLKGHIAIKKVWDLLDREAFAKEMEMIRVGKEACKMIEKFGGHYADVGIDMIIDEEMRVWILEINKLHDHRMPLYAISDRLMYEKLLASPFEYAKSLAGFK
jgi:hypothetical protein